MQACLAEQEEKERSVDPSSPTTISLLPDPVPTPSDDDKPCSDLHATETNDAVCPVDNETIVAAAITQSTISKTTRIVRRTILQNGREISVEEQVEEEPETKVAGATAEQSKRKTSRPALVQIPSPFGIVEEPSYPEDHQQRKKRGKSSVEITDVTDEYSQQSEAPSAVEDDSPDSVNVQALPASDLIVEIHEILDDQLVVDEGGKSSITIDIMNESDVFQQQTSVLYETLHELEEEADAAEKLLVAGEDGQDLEEDRDADFVDVKPKLEKGEEKSVLEMGSNEKPAVSRQSSSSSGSSSSTDTTLLEPEITHEEQVTDSKNFPVDPPAQMVSEELEDISTNAYQQLAADQIGVMPGDSSQTTTDLNVDFSKDKSNLLPATEEDDLEQPSAPAIPEVPTLDNEERRPTEAARAPTEEFRSTESNEALLGFSEQQFTVPITEGTCPDSSSTTSVESSEDIEATPEVPEAKSTASLLRELETTKATEAPIESPGAPTAEEANSTCEEKLQTRATIPIEEPTEVEIHRPPTPTAEEVDSAGTPKTGAGTTEIVHELVQTSDAPLPASSMKHDDHPVQTPEAEAKETECMLTPSESPDTPPRAHNVDNADATSLAVTETEAAKPTEESQESPNAPPAVDVAKGIVSSDTPTTETVRLVEMPQGITKVQPTDSNVEEDDSANTAKVTGSPTTEFRPTTAAAEIFHLIPTAEAGTTSEEIVQNLDIPTATVAVEDSVDSTTNKTEAEATRSTEPTPEKDVIHSETSILGVTDGIPTTDAVVAKSIEASIESVDVRSEAVPTEGDETTPTFKEGAEDRAIEHVEISPVSSDIPCAAPRTEEPEITCALSTDVDATKSTVEFSKVPVKLTAATESIAFSNTSETEVSTTESDEDFPEKPDPGSIAAVAEGTGSSDILRTHFQEIKPVEVSEESGIHQARRAEEDKKQSESCNQRGDGQEREPVTGTDHEKLPEVDLIDALSQPKETWEAAFTPPVPSEMPNDVSPEGTERLEAGKTSSSEDQSSSSSDEETEKKKSTTVTRLAEEIIDTLPDIVSQLIGATTLLVQEESEAISQTQPKEENLRKEQPEALDTLIEHRGSVAPTLGENTPGPPLHIPEQELEQVAEAEFVFEPRDAAFEQRIAEEEELKVQWQEIQELLADRLDQLRQGARSSTHTSSVRYLATVTQVTVNESAEERVVKLNDNLEALKTAVKRQEVVVIQRIVITIVRTVTEWLETIEYRIYTIKQTKSMNRRIEQIQSLSEEVRVVEETLNTLEEVTEMAVEVVNEDTKLLLHKCVKSLQEQVKSVREVTKRSEEEIELIRQRWDDFLNQISNEEEQIKDLEQKLQALQSQDQQPSQEKLIVLENIETTVQERLQHVTALLHSGHELCKEAPFYTFPETAYGLLEAVKSLEEAVRDLRDQLLHQATLTAEYQQTLKEFAEIVHLSEALAESKLSASNPDEAAQELEKRQRFLFCLSHFLQVLETLGPHLDPAIDCGDLGASLAARAIVILELAASRHEKDQMTITSWKHLEQSWLQEKNWFNEFQQEMPQISNVSADDFNSLEESFKVT